jgi:transposase
VPAAPPPAPAAEAAPTPSAADQAYAKRLRVLALADELGNISEACRIVGVSRRSFYEWKRIAEEQGNEALYPKRAR